MAHHLLVLFFPVRLFVVERVQFAKINYDSQFSVDVCVCRKFLIKTFARCEY